MIIGIGCDLMDVSRISARLKEDPLLMESLFTRAELAYCREMRYPERHLSARFAAKEALLKALPGHRLATIPWHEIETVNDSNGRPNMTLYGSLREIADKHMVSSIQLSLSHTKDSALAVVLLDSGGGVIHQV